jgi:hypothetical protein
MRRFASISIVVLVAAVTTLAQQSPALTLDAALAQALAANKTIAAARLTRAVDQAAIDVAHERPNPDISFETSRASPESHGVAPDRTGRKAR